MNAFLPRSGARKRLSTCITPLIIVLAMAANAIKQDKEIEPTQFGNKRHGCPHPRLHGFLGIKSLGLGFYAAGLLQLLWFLAPICALSSGTKSPGLCTEVRGRRADPGFSLSLWCAGSRQCPAVLDLPHFISIFFPLCPMDFKLQQQMGMK